MAGPAGQVLEPGGNLVLTACGTSLLTNAAGQTFRQKLFEHSNQREEAIPEEFKEEVDDLGHQQGERLEEATSEEAAGMSAELGTLRRIYGKHWGQEHGRPDEHILLHTDTYVGEATARVLEGWLQRQGFQARLKTFTGLQLRELTAFHRSTSEMARWCREVIGPRQGPGQGQVVFNLTGGFKAVMGFLVPLGMFYADRIVYRFQGEDALVTIPRLPMRMDPEAELVTHPIAFRRLSAGLPVDPDELSDIPETLLDRTGDRVTLSAWGEIAWGDYASEYYEEELLEPLSERIVTTDKFEKGAEKLQPDRLARLNDQMDKLAGYIESDGEHNPASLAFHKLKGSPKDKATHEFYAGSGSDATRVYGHFGSGREVFVIDAIGGHL